MNGAFYKRRFQFFMNILVVNDDGYDYFHSIIYKIYFKYLKYIMFVFVAFCREIGRASCRERV